MIVISRDLVLSSPEADDGFNGDQPLIGYHNLVTATNITQNGGSAISGYPLTNIANPSTFLEWRANETTETRIEVAISTTDELDYVGVARHNFATGRIPVSIEGAVEVDSSGDPEWFELIPDMMLADDRPIIFQFTSQSLRNIRIRMQPGEDKPRMAVMYVGRLLKLQRRIYIPHVPINYGVDADVVNGMSESGNFLGRIVLSQKTGTSVALKNLTPVWVRNYLIPFIKASKTTPFFFAWRPATYNKEVGFAWMTNQPKPANQLGNGMMAIELQMTGIVE